MTFDMPRHLWTRFGILDVPPAQPRLNTYPIDFTKPLRVLRQLLALESAEALDLARRAGMETPCH